MSEINANQSEVFEIRAADLLRVRNALRLTGTTVDQWARANGYRPGPVYAVLAGRSKALRGDGFRVACALGLIPNAQPHTNSTNAVSIPIYAGREVEGAEQRP